MLFKLSTIATIAAAVGFVSAVLMSSGAQAGGGGACHGNEPTTDAATTTIALRKSCFAPIVTRIDAGATVTFTNDDPYLHEIHGAGFAWGSTEKSIYGGESFTQTFDDEGIFPYACYLHPGMSGAIVVGDGESEVSARGGSALVSAAGGASKTTDSSSGDESRGAPTALMAGIAATVALIAGAAGGAIVMRAKR
jgi:plastocyanin